MSLQVIWGDFTVAPGDATHYLYAPFGWYPVYADLLPQGLADSANWGLVTLGGQNVGADPWTETHYFQVEINNTSTDSVHINYFMIVTNDGPVSWVSHPQG